MKYRIDYKCYYKDSKKIGSKYFKFIGESLDFIEDLELKSTFANIIIRHGKLIQMPGGKKIGKKL